MKRYRVAILCINQKTAISVKQQLDDLLGDYLDFEVQFPEQDKRGLLGSDLFLVTGNAAASQMNSLILNNSDLLIIRRTIALENYWKLLQLKGSDRLLVVNTDKESAESTVSLLYELGFRNTTLIPYYPGCDSEKDIIAVTPNEPGYAPEDVREIVDIGDRIIDPATVFDILFRLNMLSTETIEIVKKYADCAVLLNPSLKFLLNHLNAEWISEQSLLDRLDIGVLLYDQQYRTLFANQKVREYDPDGVVFNGVLPVSLVELIQIMTSDTKSFSAPWEIGGKTYLVSSRSSKLPVTCGVSGVLNITESSDLKRRAYSVTRIESAKKHKSKYNFDDIVGSSEEITKAKSLAKNFAKYSAPILITGESGTGKELFAQSIHNASSNSRGPFVAFNCAALPEALIESELFGYEEGAFTGASKHGKAGLFEVANGGTIFLDEIGDLDISLQGKLLRVLQEGELRRVGGTIAIPIDARIISATNRDLNTLVREKAFRSDLFYRLNVLPLFIEPFRNRTEDILALFKNLYSKKNMNVDLSEEVVRVMLGYDWPGNGREINNYVEYINTIEHSPIMLEDIPRYILDNAKSAKNQKSKLEIDYMILKLLYHAKLARRKMGRKSIQEELLSKGYYPTESEIRRLLEDLGEKGLVISMRGRGGTMLTLEGEELLNHLLKERDQ